MPSYDYKCSNCGHGLEIFHSIKEGGRKRCPKCKRNMLRRVISGGQYVIYRGSGFFCNDYPKDKKNEKEN